MAEQIATALQQEKRLGELSSLYEIVQVINTTADLQESLAQVLEIMSNHLGMNRGAISILNPFTQEIHVEVAHGLSTAAKSRGRYKLGEGITGRVIKTGEPIITRNISEEPLFLDRTKARQNILDKSIISFICVPITSGRKVIGALSADMVYTNDPALEEHHRLMTIIATLLCQKAISLEAIGEERERLKRENQELQNKLARRYSFTNIVGNSSKMHEVFTMIAQVAQSNATVLIRGESGTGKELVANAIHYNSLRANKPFIKINCTALPESLIEAELFGHEKGAFTGAIKRHIGKFELAQHGSIFLDEIGHIGPSVQVKLLRVLQEKQIERIGGTETIDVDVRIIAATNRNLESAIEKREFRDDLYYRLNVFPIYLPPLRERRTDILLLSDYFLEKFSSENNKVIRRISTPAIDMLVQYHWPGNVRELENVIERAVLLCQDGVIHSYHLPASLQTAEETDTKPSMSLDSSMKNFEREVLIDALKTSKGNMSKAARLLKTTERKFVYKIKQLGIDYRLFR
ncbi:MAG: sigma 54-interacting transcriptional regulator [Deltaproteobacteria bacterium]|nr:sigma 54-interacting transcriptional regulator [Deltaproteobacteria bacterium]